MPNHDMRTWVSPHSIPTHRSFSTIFAPIFSALLFNSLISNLECIVGLEKRSL